MRLRLRVVPTAERQIRAAARWWHANRPAAPDLLQEELEKAFHLVTTQPEIAPAAPNVTTQGVRRFHLSRVHYHLYCRPKSDEVEILAF